MVNRILKAAIVLHSGTQRNFARVSGIDKSKLTLFIRGKQKPKQGELEVLVQHLGLKTVVKAFGFNGNSPSKAPGKSEQELRT